MHVDDVGDNIHGADVSAGTAGEEKRGVVCFRGRENERERERETFVMRIER